MALTLFDHTERVWSSRYMRHGRENGAATYSRELVRHQAHLWADIAEDVTVSTCPLLSHVPDQRGGDVAVQYLHTYTYSNPAEQAEVVAREVGHMYQRIVFVSAYVPLVHRLRMQGFEAVYVPMTIDTEQVLPYRTTARRDDREIAYFGNITGAKLPIFNRLRRIAAGHGLELVHVKGSQREAWEELATYRHGVGVGRCALEMLALGLRVMIAGERFGGIMTSPGDFDAQRAVNLNGRVLTYDRDGDACLIGLRSSYVPPVESFDSTSVIDSLVTELTNLRGNTHANRY